MEKVNDKNISIFSGVTLQTSRLLLRPPLPADNKIIYTLRSDPRVNQYLGREPQTRIEEATAFINMINENLSAGNSYYWSIISKKSDTMIGTICLWNLSSDRKTAELGYELLPDEHGKGYMDEAIKEVIRFAFENGFTKIEAYSHQDNISSSKLLVKNGFVKDEQQIPEDKDHVIFALSKKETA